MPLTGLFNVTLEHVLPNGDLALNVLHGLWTGGAVFNHTDLQGIADALATTWTTNVRPITSNNVSLNRITMKDLAVANGETFEPVVSPITGADTGVTLPLQLAICITLNRGQPPTKRGRMYVPGFTAASNEEGTLGPRITSAARNALDLYIEDIGAAFSDNNALWKVWSRKNNSTESVNITTTVVNNRWDVQRRRANARNSV